MTTPKVSVVIASHRPECIARCLEGFSGEVGGGKEFEIIVVADYAIDRFNEEHPRVKWLFHADTGIPAKRNKGLLSAAGAIVGFIDDDCIPLPGWIASAVEFLERNHGYAGVAGQTSVEKARGASYPLREFKRLEKPGFRTNNIFYRKHTIVAAGGFDERFVVQREDIDLAFSILESGGTIGYCPDVKVLHCHRDKEHWDLLKNCRNRRFDPLLYKKHPRAYRKWIGTPFTPSITLMAALHVLVVASARYGGVFPVIAVLADAGCAFLLAIRRNAYGAFDPLQVLRDAVSYCCAPLVLIAILLYGSIRYRKVLLW